MTDRDTLVKSAGIVNSAKSFMKNIAGRKKLISKLDNRANQFKSKSVEELAQFNKQLNNISSANEGGTFQEIVSNGKERAARTAEAYDMYSKALEDSMISSKYMRRAGHVHDNVNKARISLIGGSGAIGLAGAGAYAYNNKEKTAGFINGTKNFVKNVAGRGADLKKQNEALTAARAGHMQGRASVKTLSNNISDSVTKQETLSKDLYDANARSNNLLRTQERMERADYVNPWASLKGKFKSVDINRTRNTIMKDMEQTNKSLDAEKLNHTNLQTKYQEALKSKSNFARDAVAAKGNIKTINNDVSTARKRLAKGTVGVGLIGAGTYGATKLQGQQPKGQQPQQIQGFYRPQQQGFYQPQYYPVSKQASFNEKLAAFVEEYDYPVDYADHMSTPNIKPNKGLYLGLPALGGVTGGLAGTVVDSIFHGRGRAALVGAGIGAGVGAYKAYKVNANRKNWEKNPALYKQHLQEQWDNDLLPAMYDDERKYISEVKRNIMHSNRVSSDEILHGVGAVAHTTSAVQDDKHRGSDVTIGALHGASAYNAYQKRQDNKSYRDKYLSLTPEQRTKLEHEIRTGWRNMDEDERMDEGFSVYNGEPSAFIHAINRY